MTPSAHTGTIPESDVQPETLPAAHVEILVLEAPKPKKVPSAAPAVPSPKRYEIGTFHSSIIEANRIKSGSKLLDIAISLTVNLTLLAAPILAGLYFTDTINLKQFAATFLVAPPPPPPPPPPRRGRAAKAAAEAPAAAASTKAGAPAKAGKKGKGGAAPPAAPAPAPATRAPEKSKPAKADHKPAKPAKPAHKVPAHKAPAKAAKGKKK